MLDTIILLSCLTVVATNVPKFNEMNWRDIRTHMCAVRLSGLLLTTGSALGLTYTILAGAPLNKWYVGGFFLGHAFSAMWAKHCYGMKGGAA